MHSRTQCNDHIVCIEEHEGHELHRLTPVITDPLISGKRETLSVSDASGIILMHILAFTAMFVVIIMLQSSGFGFM